ncbi:mechanosensitive ion channel family protein [Rhizobium sp. BR 314]|uniref:mechanosensitive ion channel family protein n=1 Tax=Rhizobium sp. BR 314 TaxID=3040013 RepID=UPI0039BF7CCC
MPNIQTLIDSFVDGLSTGLHGIPHLWDLVSTLRARMIAEGAGWSVPIDFVALLLGASMAAILVRSMIALAVNNNAFEISGHSQRLGSAIRRLMADLAGLIAFAAFGCFVTQVLDIGMLGRMMIAAVLDSFVIATGYWIASRVLFSTSSDGPLVQSTKPQFHMTMLVAYGFGAGLLGEVLQVAATSGVNEAVIAGWLVVGATLLMVLKLCWFLIGAHDIRKAFRGAAPGGLRRAIAIALPWLYAGSAIVIWAAGCIAVVSPQRVEWSFAAGTTQIMLLVLPVAALGIHSLGAGYLSSVRERDDRSFALAAITAALQTAITGGIWFVGTYLIYRLWQPLLSADVDRVAAEITRMVARGAAAVILSWSAWSYLHTYFEAMAPSPRASLPGDREEMAVPSSRLYTVMPFVRNALFIATVVISILVVLSSLGIDTGPLLAGFGIFGLAVSFGSQTLIKDIVSGIFFLADDAFRVGEYVDTGKLKGTVEKISLRSLQLRHQNGPLHTIPFGQIQAVSNYSRDWSTIKFEMRFDRDADPDQIRRTVKRVGIAMQEDPDIGEEFLVPLKMQGLQDITDSSLVVRPKFTAKPGNPGILQREAMRRLLIAFRENGIPLSSNAVIFRSEHDPASAPSVGRGNAGDSGVIAAPS